MSADVSRVVALGQVVELRKKASQAKRKAVFCDNFSQEDGHFRHRGSERRKASMSGKFILAGTGL